MLLWEATGVTLRTDKNVASGWIPSSNLPEEIFLPNGLLQSIRWFPFPPAGHGSDISPRLFSTEYYLPFLVCLFVLANVSKDSVFSHLLSCSLSGVHRTQWPTPPPLAVLCVSHCWPAPLPVAGWTPGVPDALGQYWAFSSILAPSRSCPASPHLNVAWGFCTPFSALWPSRCDLLGSSPLCLSPGPLPCFLIQVPASITLALRAAFPSPTAQLST